MAWWGRGRRSGSGLLPGLIADVRYPSRRSQFLATQARHLPGVAVPSGGPAVVSTADGVLGLVLVAPLGALAVREGLVSLFGPDRGIAATAGSVVAVVCGLLGPPAVVGLVLRKLRPVLATPEQRRVLTEDPASRVELPVSPVAAIRWTAASTGGVVVLGLVAALGVRLAWLGVGLLLVLVAELARRMLRPGALIVTALGFAVRARGGRLRVLVPWSAVDRVELRPWDIVLVALARAWTGCPPRSSCVEPAGRGQARSPRCCPATWTPTARRDPRTVDDSPAYRRAIVHAQAGSPTSGPARSSGGQFSGDAPGVSHEK